MSLNLGTMYVTLEARTATFVKDMATASQSVMDFGESARKTGRFLT